MNCGIFCLILYSQHSASIMAEQKTIKIFIASSQELEPERKELSEVVCSLNSKLHMKGVFILLEKWEYFDQCMSSTRKQDDFNSKLEGCDICIFMFWNRLGKYTLEEFDLACKRCREGLNPKKLYVYFKEAENNIDDGLKSFRDSFHENYQHAVYEFRNIDALILNFLFILIDSDILTFNRIDKEISDVKIKDSHIYAFNEPLADLTNVSFVGNNQQYISLLKSIKSSQRALGFMTFDHPEYADEARQLLELKKSKERIEQDLLQTALTITKFNSTESSERLNKAVRLFNNGDCCGANALLNDDDLFRDIELNRQSVKVGKIGKIGLKKNLSVLAFKISLLSTDRPDDWENSIMIFCDKVLDISEDLYDINSFEYCDVMHYLSDVYCSLYKYDDALRCCEHSLEICTGLFGEDDSKVADCYDRIGKISWKSGKIEDAISYGIDALENRQKLNEDSIDLMMSYVNLGTYAKAYGEYDYALVLTKKALEMSREFCSEYDSAKATIYLNLGSIFDDMGRYRESIDNTENALDIRIKLNGPESTAVADCYVNLACAFKGLNEYDKAIYNMEMALQTRLETYGELSLEVADCYQNLGSWYGDIDNHTKAMMYAEKSFDIRKAILDQNHPLIGKSLESIGCELCKKRKYHESITFFDEALMIYRCSMQEVSEATCYGNKGYALSKLNKEKSALACHNKSLEILLKKEYKGGDVANCYNSIACSLFRLAEKEVSAKIRHSLFLESIENFNKAAEFYKNINGDLQNRIKVINENIASAYNKIEKEK